MCFSKSVTAKSMAETIRSTDPIKQCAELIRQSLLDTDFELNDRFCDANDLKTPWNNVSIPEPLLKFFEALYRFDATYSCSSSGVRLLGSVASNLYKASKNFRRGSGIFTSFHDVSKSFASQNRSFRSKSVSNKDCLISSAHCLMGSVERMVSAMLLAVTLLLKH